MSAGPALHARFRHDVRGAALVELALVLPVMLLVIMGLLDLGHQAYVQAQLQGALQDAGRNSTLERNASNGTAIDAEMRRRVDVIARGAEWLSSDRLNYKNFSDVARPEDYTDNKPANGRYDAGECFEDENSNGRWDKDAGATGQGGASDVVLYTVKIRYRRLFPISLTFGDSQYVTTTASTTLRNQPYDKQLRPAFTPC